MAIIRNELDSYLQSQSPRLLKIDSNYINLAPTALLFRSTATGTSPSTIAIQAFMVGELRGTVTWTRAGNVGTVSGNTLTLSSSDIAAGTSLSIQASIVYLGQTYTATTTITHQADTLSSVLSAEAIVIPTNADGAGGNYTGASTTMSIFIGDTDTSTSWTYSWVRTSGTATATGTNTRTLTITDLTTDSATYNVTATRAGWPNQQKTFRISKAKAGLPGANGANGANGTRTAILQVYKWAASKPTSLYPSGFSTYTWSTGSFSAPSTSNGWSVLPTTPVAGQTLWVAREVYTDIDTTTTSSVLWNIGSLDISPIAYSGTDGQAGVEGLRGSVVAFGSNYDIRSTGWVDGIAQRVIKNVLDGESLKTSYSVTTHLRLGDTVTLSGPSPWIETKGTYSSGTTYYAGNLVIYSSSVYIALTTTTGVLPTNTTNWGVYVGTITSRGAWASSTLYNANDTVTGSNPAGVTVTWIAKYSHTSASTFSTDRDGNGFSETRFWGGSSWLRAAQILDGNLLVRGSITGDKLAVDSIDVSRLSNGSTLSSSDGYFKLGGNSSLLSATLNGIIMTSVNYDVPRAGVSAVSNNTSIPALVGTTNNASGWGLGAFYFSGFTTDTKVSQFVAGNSTYAALADHTLNSKSVFLGHANYCAYSAAGRGTAKFVDGVGQFTGYHDGITTGSPELGDIYVDYAILEHLDVSNTLARFILSSAPMQKGVIGVCSLVHSTVPLDWEDVHISETDIIINVNALGEGLINVCGENGNIERGDLIVTSSIPGKGMKQNDDIVRSYTVAKAREPVTFSSPTEIKQVACIYLSG